MSSIPSNGAEDGLFSPKYNESDMAQELARISEKLNRREQTALLHLFTFQTPIFL